MITDTEVNFFLEHHGIKGQKWGIRRQLDSLKKSHENRKEKGAKKYEAKAKIFQTRISELKDFSLITDGDITEITSLFLKAQKG